MDKKTYTTFDISKICGVYPTTVINWINQKKLPSFSTPGGHHRVKAEDLMAFLKEYNFPVPPGLGAVSGRKKVLIVDDDGIFAKMLSRAFGTRKDLYEVSVLHDGYQALLAVGKAPPDLLVIDVVMPVMDGPTVCRNIKADPANKGIRIIAVTGERLAPAAEKEVRKFCDSLLRKPLDVDQLLGRAGELLGVGQA
jgi:two-component system, OmpR family, response regulator VicR